MADPFNLRRASETDANLVADIHIISRAATYRDQLSDHYINFVMPLETLSFWPQRMIHLAATDGVLFIAENHELIIYMFFPSIKVGAREAYYLQKPKHGHAPRLHANYIYRSSIVMWPLLDFMNQRAGNSLVSNQHALVTRT